MHFCAQRHGRWHPDLRDPLCLFPGQSAPPHRSGLYYDVTAFACGLPAPLEFAEVLTPAVVQYMGCTPMTIGQLSRRTGVPIKVLREYEHLGLIYTRGRSASNYRLFDEEAVWCVQVTQGLRSLGLTLNEIHDLVAVYLDHRGESVEQALRADLRQALLRVEARIADLQALRQRILDFEAASAGMPAPPSASSLLQLLASDPRRASLPSAE